MKVVHFTNNTFDGAGKAAYRLHKSLLGSGLDSKMVVLEKSLDDDTVVEIKPKVRIATYKEIFQRERIRHYPDIIRVYLNKVLLRFLSKKIKPGALFNFNAPLVTLSIIKQYLKDVDIICLHSVQYFLSPELISSIYKTTKATFVWTLMDIEPVTGGCHFNNGCARFEDRCGNCPQLKKPGENDLSRKIFNRKAKYLKDLPITFVAGSSWVTDHIKRSSLFKDKWIKNIFLSVEEVIYKDIDKQSARESLKLPQNKKIILFGCFNHNDKRKGADHLLEALIRIPEKIPADKKSILKDILLLTFGNNDGFSFSGSPFEWRHLGLLKNKQELANIYHVADLLAVPSFDDCGPMMVNEAFMCKVPIVAYKVGVSPDLIRSEQSGYIAERNDINDFCSGIIHCLLLEEQKVQSNETEELRMMCTVKCQVDQYQVLFNDSILRRQKRG